MGFTWERTRNVRISHGLLLLAAFGFSFILVFSTLLKHAGVSSLQQVLFRVVITLPLILLLIRCEVKLSREDLPYFILTGFVFSAFLLSALSSIVLGTPIAVATALIYTQPLFTAVLAGISGREKIGVGQLTIVAIGVLGAFLASGIFSEQMSSPSLLGVLAALLGGFLYAVYLFLKRMPQTTVSPLHALFNTFLFALPCTVVLGSALRFFTDSPILIGFSTLNPEQFLILALFGLFGTALPYAALNYVRASEVSPTTEGLVLLLDPLLNTLWAILVFHQYVSLLRYVGLALILTSGAAMLKIGSK